MNWTDLEDFSAYERELPCPNCKQPAKPTVCGNHMKCAPCGHVFNEDGSPMGVECHCVKCNPFHDPLADKTKGKSAELQLPEKKSSRGKPRQRRPDTRSKH
jgi:hypothetical protein